MSSTHGSSTVPEFTSQYVATGKFYSLRDGSRKPRTGRPAVAWRATVGVATRRNHRIVAAGDLNILRGYGEYGNSYWKARYATVFARAEAMGLRCVGPHAPNGRQAEPWPDELPPDSVNVPTYHTNRQTPATATRQLDFVFASDSIADGVATAARNEVHERGASDHCKIDIQVTV